MRVKISFQRTPDSNHSVPLHHQKLVSYFMKSIIEDLNIQPEFYNFSSLKGTSKVQNGFMRFLSSKVSLVISSNNSSFIEAFMAKLFEKQTVNIGKLILIPRHQQVMDYPDFKTKMKYVCISPLVLVDPDHDQEMAMEIVDPSSHDFSDFIYNAVTEKMEKAGYTDEQLNQFAEFEVLPDAAYITKIVDSGKKFARLYKSNSDNPMMGYLIPFTLHAHPEVHKFIWDCGLGMLNEQGYGMIDIVPDVPMFNPE